MVHQFIQKLPKAELHVHIEGTLEPEQLLRFAARNNVAIPYTTVEQIRASHQFADLASFIDNYSQATHVLCKEQDFYELMQAYLKKAFDQGVLHAEIFFDLQTYLPRGIMPEVVINGLHRAINDAQKNYGITAFLILCLLREHTEKEALELLDMIAPYKEAIIGIGLASVEKGNPPEKFQEVFAQARAQGYRIVAHAGEETGPEMIWQAIERLHVERIDHGIACMQDPALVRWLCEHQLPLTVCPLSNVALKASKDLAAHPIKQMVEAGLLVTINSDDPAFFSGYIAENYQAVADQFGFSKEVLASLARNSFKASFLNEEQKERCLELLTAYAANN